MGSEYSAYHSTDIYANAGWQMEWYVQTESEGLHCSCSWQSLIHTFLPHRLPRYRLILPQEALLRKVRRLYLQPARLGQGPWQGDMNAVIASCSEYTYLTQGKRVDGTMYSCTSLGGPFLANWQYKSSPIFLSVSAVI